MSTMVENEFEAILRGIGRAWVWILAFGVISAFAGLAALFWPSRTLLIIAIVFAVQLILGAVYRFVGAFSIPGETGWLRALQALLAVLSLVVGVYLLGHLALSLLLLSILLGVYWMVHGVIELFVAIGHRELPGRVWMVVSGVLSTVAGAIVIVMPDISLFVLTLVLGVWLIVFGVMLAISAYHVRSTTRAFLS